MAGIYRIHHLVAALVLLLTILGNAFAADRTLPPGEYITEQGWGFLRIVGRTGKQTFSLETLTGESVCALGGMLQGRQGIGRDSQSQAPACMVRLVPTAKGIEVSTDQPEACRTYCGSNGSFTGLYLRPGKGCSASALAHTRTHFQHLYDDKHYAAALATLTPVLNTCQSTLSFEEEGAIRNDLAITQYRLGRYAQCLHTLAPYAEDAANDDDAVIDGMTRAYAERYLPIVQSARTNIGLCRKK